MPVDNEDDVAYALETGYYPQIANKVFSKRHLGTKHGSTGEKYARVQGWGASSIAKAKFAKMEWEEKYFAARFKHSGPHMAELERQAKSRGIDSTAAKDFPQRRKKPIQFYEGRDRETQEMKWRFKWVGGGDNYRLYGDQVWYMHGKGRNDLLAPYIESFRTEPQFQRIYTGAEEQMIIQAKAMATEMFNDAILVAEIQESVIEALDMWGKEGKIQVSDFNRANEFESMSAEEVGYEAGNYKYIPYKIAIKDDRIRAQLDEISKRSFAQPRDMVKIKDGVVVETADVTEMSLTQLKQHGIVNVPKELLKAVKAVRKEGGGHAGFPGGGASINTMKLKKQVEAMFINAIQKSYNPTIQYLKDFVAKVTDPETGEKMRMENFDNLIDAVLQEKNKNTNKAPTDGMVSVQDIANQSGMKLTEQIRQSYAETTFNKSLMKYLTHMLATYGQNAGQTFRQMHRVADVGGGESIYAIVPMRQSDKTFLFLEAPVKKTKIVTGYNATLALAVKNKELTREEARITSFKQKQARMIAGAHRSSVHGADHARTLCGLGLKKGVQATTKVTIFGDTGDNAAGKNVAMNKALAGIFAAAKIPGSKGGRNITTNANKILREGGYKYNPPLGKDGKRNMGAGVGGKLRSVGPGEHGSTGFWALPYIGIAQSEHQKKSGQL
jgi:hypothetical protein